MTRSTPSGRRKIVIVGAGFGGLSAARALAHSPVDTLVIDRNNYHTFQALLYQVAAAELEPEEISYPIRTILRSVPNASFMMAEVQGIDLDARTVRTGAGPILYDYIILAAGSTTSFFGVSGAEENVFQLKTLDNAITLRNHILCCLEESGTAAKSELRQGLLTFVIVGGGPTGVEFAGALAELMRGPIMKDYRHLSPGNIRIVLLQAVDSLLPDLPSRLRQYALQRLRRMGVEVFLSTAAARVTPDGVHLNDGGFIPSTTVVWTAGVRGDSLAENSGLPVARDGRVQVLPSLQVPGHTDAYVIGDSARVQHDGHPLPFTAPPAIQQGAAAAMNINRQLQNLDPVPFRYKDKGSLATIGRMAAVARIGQHEFKGLIAWTLWLAVHVFNLIGFRNRILVMVNWAWDFFFYERAVRLILPSESCSGLRESPSGKAPKPQSGDESVN